MELEFAVHVVAGGVRRQLQSEEALGAINICLPLASNLAVFRLVFFVSLELVGQQLVLPVFHPIVSLCVFLDDF